VLSLVISNPVENSKLFVVFRSCRELCGVWADKGVRQPEHKSHSHLADWQVGQLNEWRLKKDLSSVKVVYL